LISYSLCTQDLKQIVKQKFHFTSGWSQSSAPIFVLVITSAIGIAISFLFFAHLYLTLTGQTSIEYCERVAEASLCGKKKKHPYDMGWKQNWQQVFGNRNFFVMILPSSRSI